MSKLLKGKTALITGAARGIGKATALILAKEGANVALVDIIPEMDTTSQQILAMGRRTTSAVFDIANPEEASKSVRKISNALGVIDILVNNAAIVNNIATLIKMSHESWSREISVNLSGAFNMIKETIEGMIENKWGRIINISSGGASGGLYGQSAYAASKAGLLGLTKTVTIEHAKDGITCNAILPGMVNTEMVKKMPETIKNSLEKVIPSGEFGDMNNVAHLIAFLASDKAGYINGAEIPIDGGARLNNMIILGSRKLHL